MDKLTCAVVVLVVAALVVSCAVACLGVLLVADIGLGSPQWATAEETIASEVSVDPPASLRVDNPVGNVTIRTGPEEDRVVVRATKIGRAPRRVGAERVMNEIEVQVRPEGSRVSVDVVRPDSTGLASTRVKLVITVPERIDVEVLNDAGHVMITGVEGNVRVRSESGALRMDDVAVTDRLDVMNTTGPISFQGRVPEPGTGEPWEVLLRTETGDVEFLAPPDSQFTLDAESETGSVTSKFELQQMESGPDDGVGRWLKGGVNRPPGGGDVVLRTETGTIVVAPLE